MSELLNAVLASTCFNCVSDKPAETVFNACKAFLYSAVPFAIEDIFFTVFKAVPKLLAEIALALNAVDNVVIAFTIPIATNPFKVDSTSPRLFTNCNVAFPQFNNAVTVCPLITD